MQFYYAAVLSRAWAMTLADFGIREVRPVLANALLAAFALIVMMLAGGFELVSSHVGKVGAAAVAAAVLGFVFYLANVPRAAASIHEESSAEIATLRKRLRDDEAHQAAVNV